MDENRAATLAEEEKEEIRVAENETIMHLGAVAFVYVYVFVCVCVG